MFPYFKDIYLHASIQQEKMLQDDGSFLVFYYAWMLFDQSLRASQSQEVGFVARCLPPFHGVCPPS